MKKLIKYFIKYPSWPNVIKIVVLLFGFAAILNLQSSFFPEIENRVVIIQIIYPGASPSEIEKGAIQKIEDNITGIQGIERYTSQSRENSANITIEIFKGYDPDEVLQDIKNAVNSINSFPAAMEPPVVFKQKTIEFAISFSLSGDVSLKALKEAAEEVEDELRQEYGISQIALSGFPEEEIEIAVSDKVLRQHDLTFDDVLNAVRAANFDLSLGSIKTEKEEIRLRMNSKGYYANDLKEIIVISKPDGSIIKLFDIAEVADKWEESSKRTYVNGQKSVVVTVNKILGEDIIEISEKVNEFIEKYNKEHRVITASVLDDNTIVLQDRLSTLLSSGLVGAILVLMSLSLFLRLRLSFWVALGLPFSFLGMFIFLYISGLTINAISLFGCIVVVGILVDDGIVIAEQIFQKHEEGLPPFRAAMNGTIEVMPSVVFAILTTITAFTPFFFFAGSQGENMRDLGFVVIVTLIFSLIEALLILPSHLAHSKAIREAGKEGSLRNKLDNILMYPRDKLYSSSLKFAMNSRIFIISLAIFLTIITVGAYQGGLIGATFFPYLDSNKFEIYLEMPPGTRGDVTEEYLSKIEKAVWKVNEDFREKRQDGKDVILKVQKNIAQGPTGIFGKKIEGGSHEGTLRVILLNSEERKLDSYILANAVKDKMGPLYEAENVLYGAGSSFGKPISVPLISSDLEEIRGASDELKDSLNAFPELKDVNDNSPAGEREIRLKMKEKAYLYGVNELMVAMQLRQGFFGGEVQRLQRGNDEIKVWVRYPRKDRKSVVQFEDTRIKLPNGSKIPLSELVEFEIGREVSVINHLDGKREITVDAEMVDQNAEVPPVLSRVENDVLPKILKKYPTVKTAESGQQREIMKTARSARTTMTIALVIMFFLISLSFRSYAQAVLVFLLFPLGFIGASWGHFIHGIPINMMSAYGIIALLGIIVNDSIVFINTLNGKLADGIKFSQAVYETGMNRFRPILLTTVTTVAGLYPLILSSSRQATFLIPMAISVAYGLMLGSFFILIFLPVFLIYLNRSRRFLKKLWTGNEYTAEEVEPAVSEKAEMKKYFGDDTDDK